MVSKQVVGATGRWRVWPPPTVPTFSSPTDPVEMRIWDLAHPDILTVTSPCHLPWPSQQRIPTFHIVGTSLILQTLQRIWKGCLWWLLELALGIWWKYKLNEDFPWQTLWKLCLAWSTSLYCVASFSSSGKWGQSWGLSQLLSMLSMMTVLKAPNSAPVGVGGQMWVRFYAFAFTLWWVFCTHSCVVIVVLLLVWFLLQISLYDHETSWLSE